MEAWKLLAVIAGSFVAGYLGSMIGLVLGTLRLPLILLVSGSASTAAGTNIAISAASAASGGLRHSRAGRVDWTVVRWMAPPSVVGAAVGGFYDHAVPERLLFGVIAAVLALILGTLRIPALLGAVGLTAARAVGTNLVVGFFLGAFGFVGHAVRREIEWPILAAGLAGGMPGGWLGAQATGRFSEVGLRRALGVGLLAIAVAFAVEAALRS